MSKPPMDDLTTLFIGNNLQPQSMQPPSDDFSYERRSNILSPNLLGMLAFLGEYTPHFASGWTPPDAAPAVGPDVAFLYDSATPNGYAAAYGTLTPNVYGGGPAGAVRAHEPALGHPLHYAQCIAPEAGLFLRPVYSVPLFSPPPVPPLDMGAWADAPRPQTKVKAEARAALEKNAGEGAGVAPGMRVKPARRPAKATLKGSRAPKISIDYSPRAVTQLLDLLPEQGAPVLSGFLHGRLFTNDQDNYNYMTVVSGEPDPARSHKPSMVACYRRNFISLHLRVGAPPKLPRAASSTYRLEVSAVVTGDEPEPAEFFVAEAKSDTAKANPLEPVSIGTSHVFTPPSDGGELFFAVKKLQFKSATANSINLNFQTYYRLRVRLYDGTDADSSVVLSVISCPIVVRGRNPSFYEDRRDVLISGRAPALRLSYAVDAAPPVSPAPEPLPVHESVEVPKTETDAEVCAPDPPRKLGRYHYFPMLNVYYTPPINVVYFPHGAHQARNERGALRPPLLDREPRVYFT